MSDRNIFGMKKKNKFLDEEIIDRLLYAVSEGSYIEDACAFAGITSRTYRTWRERAENGEEYFVDLYFV